MLVCVCASYFLLKAWHKKTTTGLTHKHKKKLFETILRVLSCKCVFSANNSYKFCSRDKLFDSFHQSHASSSCLVFLFLFLFLGSMFNASLMHASATYVWIHTHIMYSVMPHLTFAEMLPFHPSIHPSFHAINMLDHIESIPSRSTMCQKFSRLITAKYNGRWFNVILDRNYYIKNKHTKINSPNVIQFQDIELAISTKKFDHKKLLMALTFPKS